MQDHVAGSFNREIECNQDYQKVPGHHRFVSIIDINVDMSLVFIGKASDGFDEVSGISRGYNSSATRKLCLGR